MVVGNLSFGEREVLPSPWRASGGFRGQNGLSWRTRCSWYPLLASIYCNQHYQPLTAFNLLIVVHNASQVDLALKLWWGVCLALLSSLGLEDGIPPLLEVQ